MASQYKENNIYDGWEAAPQQALALFIHNFNRNIFWKALPEMLVYLT